MKASGGVLTLGKKYTSVRDNIITDIKKGEMCGKKRIAGIPCFDELKTEQMLNLFTEENFLILGIKDKLKKEDLPFKAIIPTDFYNQIKQRKEVYTFKNIDEDGYVPVAKEEIERFAHKEVRAFNTKSDNFEFSVNIALLGIAIITIILVERLLYSYWISSAEHFWGGMLVSNFIAFFIFTIVCKFIAELTDLLLQRFTFTSSALCNKVGKKLSSLGYKLFWPKYSDSVNGPKIKINFKAPPPIIADNILKWEKEGYKVHISAQKEAFTLNIESIKSLIQPVINKEFEDIKKQKELELKVKIEARKRFFQKPDPIISTEVDGFTVLIDAYGGKSFISEMEVINSVQEYYNEKLKQFQTILN